MDAQIVVMVTPDLKVNSVSSSFVPRINLETTPKITKEEALKVSEESSNSQTDLIIYSPAVYNQEELTELAWKIIGL